MPVSLAQIAANTATARMEFEGGDLNIVYYPLKISDEMLLQLQSFASATESSMPGLMDDLNGMLVEVIASWDLLEDDNATPIALTKARLAGLSPVIKTLAVQCILSSIRPEALAPKIKSSNGNFGAI